MMQKNAWARTWARSRALQVLIITTAALITLAALESAGQDPSDLCEADIAFTFEASFGGGRSHQVYQTLDGALLFEAPLAINTDGAPNSYHPRGRPAGALNTVCNGVNIYVPPDYRERVDYRQCSRLIALFNQARDAQWLGEGVPRVDWYGIASVGEGEPERYLPCIVEEGPYAGYFVSTTALLADASADRCSQERYVNSLTVPAYVVPGRSDFGRFGARIGDVGVAFNPNNGISSPFVIGDVGPTFHLGEGTLALAWHLLETAPIEVPTRVDVANAQISNDLRIVILPGDPMRSPITGDQVRNAVEARLAEWGTSERLDACLNRSLP
ncbi:MAG: hypothetical protein AAGG65_08120 [Pseudomonadota bacterium]